MNALPKPNLVSENYIFETRGLIIELINEISEMMKISTKETLKPFGGSLPEGSIVRFPTNWKEYFCERLSKQFTESVKVQDNLAKALVTVTFAVARFIQEKMDWTSSKAGTVAIEYVLSTLALEYPTDIMEVGEYCQIVGRDLKPAYKALNRAKVLIQPTAFEEDWKTAVSVDGKKTSKSEINEEAKNAYFTICLLTHNTHIGLFRQTIQNVFPIFETEAAWKAIRGIADPADRNGVIALLKKRISETGDPIVTLTDVTIAKEQVINNQILSCGIPTGVTMDAYFKYLKAIHGERVTKETNRTIQIGPMPVDSFLQGFQNTYGYVGNARIEQTNGAIAITFTLRETSEDEAGEIGVPVSLRHYRQTIRRRAERFCPATT